jgi:hypothetical protein
MCATPLKEFFALHPFSQFPGGAHLCSFLATHIAL